MNPKAVQRHFRSTHGRKGLVTITSLLAALVLALLTPLAAQATTPTTWYVNSGSDLKTIQAAIDIAKPGDTIQVAAGTYAESPSISKTLNLVGPNNLISPNDPMNQSIANSARVAEAVITGTITLTSVAVGSTISGFTINGPGRGISASGASAATDNVVISKNIFEKDNSAVYWADNAGLGSSGNGKNWTLTDNRASTTSGADITAFYGWYLSNLTVTDNVIIGYSRGMQFPSSVAGTFNVKDNLFLDIKLHGLQIAYPGVKEGGTYDPYNAGNLQWIVEGNTFRSINTSLLSALRVGGTPTGNAQVTMSIKNNLFDITSVTSGASAIRWESQVLAPQNILSIANNRFSLSKAYAMNYVAGPNSQTIQMTSNAWPWASETTTAKIAATVAAASSVSGISFTTSPWISSYTNDPAKVGKPGFWPVISQQVASIPVSAVPQTVPLALQSAEDLAVVLPQIEGEPVSMSLEAKTAADLPATESAPFSLDGGTFFTFTLSRSIGPVKICVAGSAPSRLWHYTNNAWVDVTDAVQDVAGKVCGTVTDFSPFALAAPAPIQAPAEPVFVLPMRAQGPATISGSASAGMSLTCIAPSFDPAASQVTFTWFVQGAAITTESKTAEPFNSVFTVPASVLAGDVVACHVLASGPGKTSSIAAEVKVTGTIPEVRLPDGRGEQVGLAPTTASVTFALLSATLTNAERNELRALVSKGYRTFTVTSVVPRGRSAAVQAYNVKLSQRRAANVAIFLRALNKNVKVAAKSGVMSTSTARTAGSVVKVAAR